MLRLARVARGTIGRGGIGRATLSSVVATACDYLAFSALVNMSTAATTATLCGCGVGALVNFTLNRHWAFESRVPWIRAAVRYIGVSGTSALGNAALVALFASGLGWPARAAWVFARCTVFLGLTYPLFRGWVFYSKDVAEAASAAVISPNT